MKSTMDIQYYETPETTIIEMAMEGLLCASGIEDLEEIDGQW